MPIACLAIPGKNVAMSGTTLERNGRYPPCLSRTTSIISGKRRKLFRTAIVGNPVDFLGQDRISMTASLKFLGSAGITKRPKSFLWSKIWLKTCRCWGILGRIPSTARRPFGNITRVSMRSFCHLLILIFIFYACNWELLENYLQNIEQDRPPTLNYLRIEAIINNLISPWRITFYMQLVYINYRCIKFVMEVNGCS